jgi:predicted nucleic acid-binding protein
VYDCLYVALAVQSKTAMVSDDRRLVNALIDGPLKDHVAWLGAEE